MSEGLEQAESFVALTNVDEENILLSLFARKHSRGKVATKVNRLEFDDILEGLDAGSVVFPKYITSDYIIQYVRAFQNKAGSNLKTLYRILDDRVEALEFTVQEKSELTDIPLAKLRLKKNQLICCITRGEQVIIPRGGDTIQEHLAFGALLLLFGEVFGVAQIGQIGYRELGIVVYALGVHLHQSIHLLHICFAYDN
jgi:trk system potassium uptake protein TrkA